MAEDLDDAGEPEEEPERWHELVVCPSCGGDETQFLELRYEVSVYRCLRCGLAFEVEE